MVPLADGVGGMFVCDVEEAYAGESADEEYHVKPAVVEVELKLP